MMIFSKIMDFEPKTEAEKCEKHDINLVSAFNRKAICSECVKEKQKEEETKIVANSINEYERKKTQGVLYHSSIFLDSTLKHATFETYETLDNETVKNKEHALNIAREYFKGFKYNTILTGNAGTGKSHLAMSMLKVINECSEPYKKCLFVSIDEVIRRIKDSFNNRQSKYTESYVINLLTDVDVLVIDDLGAETGAIGSNNTASDFTVKILYSIINGRMDKPTIFTTNLTSREINNMYDSKLVSRILRGTKGHTIQFKETTDKRIDNEF